MNVKIKKLVKLSAITLLIPILLTNCNYENELELQEDNQIQQNVITKTVKPEEIPQVMGFLNQETDNKLTFIINDNGRTDIQNRNPEDNIEVGEVLTDEILTIIDDSQKTNYTFGLSKENQSDPYFLNLIVKETSANYYAYITKYEYDENWLNQQDANLDYSTYTGKVIYYKSDGTYVSKFEMVNGQKVNYNFLNPCDNNQNDGNGNETLLTTCIQNIETGCDWSVKYNDEKTHKALKQACDSNIVIDDENDLVLVFDGIGILMNLEFLFQEDIHLPDDRFSWAIQNRPLFKELILLLNDDFSDEAIMATQMTFETLRMNNLQGPYDEFYFQTINPFTSIDLLDIPTLNSNGIPNYVVWQTHFSAKCAMLQSENLSWPTWRVYWEASKEMIHLGLDIAGMAPVVGVVFDVTNALLYTIEGEGTQAFVSSISAIPVVGQWASGAKFARKSVLLSNGKKVYLRIYHTLNDFFKFSGRSQLRKVLGLTDSSIHAHHVIPYSLGIIENATTEFGQLIQKAANYTDSLPLGNGVWHINDLKNGIGMPENLHLLGHSDYLNAVKVFDNGIGANDFEQAYNLLNNFTNALKNKIVQNPTWNSGQFVTFINNYIP